MWTEEGRKWLYNEMINNGVDAGSYEDFVRSMDDDNDRKWYYEQSQNMGLNVGSMEQFNAAMMTPKVQNDRDMNAQMSNNTYQTAETTRVNIPEPAQLMPNGINNMNVSEDWKQQDQYKVNEQGNARPYTMLETEESVDKDGIRHTQPKLVMGSNGTDVYRNAMTGEEYDPMSAEGMQMRADNTRDEETFVNVKRANREQVSALSNDVENKLTDLRTKLDKEAMDKFGKRFTVPTYASPVLSQNMPVGSAQNALESYVESNQSYRALMSAKNSLKNAQDIIDEADKAINEGVWEGATLGTARGFGNKFFDPRTWDMGVSELQDNAVLYTALKKADKGDDLTEEELAMLDAKAVEMATNAYFGSYVGRGYKAGQVTAESLPFMLEMCINPAAKAGQTAQSMLTRYALKRFGKKAALELMERAERRGVEMGVGRLTKELGKKEAAKIIAGRVAGDLAGSVVMTGTTGMAGVIGDTYNRMNGDLQFETDDNGYSVFDFDAERNAEDFSSAFAKAFGARTIENYSEMFGEYFEPITGALGAVAKSGMKKIGLGKVNDLIENAAASDLARLVSDFERHAKWNGLFSEYAEEVSGNVMNAILVGDNNFSLHDVEGNLSFHEEGSIFNLSDNVDTFLGTALMGGVLSGIKSLGYRSNKYKAKQNMMNASTDALKTFSDPTEWWKIRNVIDAGTDDEVKAELERVSSDANLSREQKAAVMVYAMRRKMYEGTVMGDQKRRTELNDDTRNDVETSFDNGYSLESPEEMSDAKIMLDYQRQRIETTALSEGLIADLEGRTENDPIETLLRIRGYIAYSDEEKQIALDFLNAVATYKGLIQHVNDNIDEQLHDSDATIDARKNRRGANAGSIVRGTMKLDDRKVYVIDGDVKMFDDGSMVDNASSSQSVLVMDAVTGKIEFVSANDILSVDDPVDAETEKEAARKNIRESIATDEANKIDGVLPFNPGDVYDLKDQQGNDFQATVVNVNDDGSVMVSINGAEAVPMSKEMLQEMSDAENMSRLAEYEAGKAMAENGTVEDQAAQLPDTGNEQEGQPIMAENNLDEQLPGTEGEEQNEPEIGAALRTDGNDNINVVGAEANEGGADEINGTELNNGADVTPMEDDAMPMIGEGDNAEPDFMAVSPERGYKYLFGESGLGVEDAKAFVDNNVAEANKELDKIDAKKPKIGTSISKYNKDLSDWKKKVDAAKARLKYWQDVMAARATELKRLSDEQRQKDAEAHDQAVEELKQYDAEQKRKAEEQAALGANTVAPAIRDKWNGAVKVEGALDSIVLPNGEEISGRYVMVESGVPTASHDANNGFAMTDGYPVDENGGSVNDRDYERDKDAQRTTRNIANNYDQRAVQTPVVVSGDGVVLSGNGRTMAGEIAAAQGTDGAYIDYVRDHAGKWGFTSEQVSGMQHPRVVFVPTENMPYTSDTFAKFNAQEMKSQSKTEQAVKLGKVVDDATFGRITNKIGAFDTIGDFYADADATAEVIGELQKAGVVSSAQMAEMFDGDGISNAGKELIENVLIGKAFESNPDALRQLTEFKSLRQSVMTALSAITDNAKLGEDYSLIEDLAQAIDLAYKARIEGGYNAGDRVSGYARQMNLGFYGEAETVADFNNAVIMMLADVVNDNRVSRLKTVLQSYNSRAELAAAGQMDLFADGLDSKEDIIKDVMNLLNYGTEQTTKQGSAKAEGGSEQNGNAGRGSEGAGNVGRGQENTEQSEERQGNLEESEGVRNNEFGYSESDYADEKALNEQYAKRLEEISKIEDDDAFEKACNDIDESLPSGFAVSVDKEGKCTIELSEPSVYYDFNGTRRKFKIGDQIQINYEGRSPHLIVVRIDDNGKIVEAIDAFDGRTIIENGKLRSINDVLNDKKRISDIEDQNGSKFLISSNGTIDFGNITADRNLSPAPIRLALGTTENGYLHIEERHGEQIRNAGFKDTFEFIDHVLNNYNIIREGDSYDNENGGKNQTYYVQLTDKHNNTIFIQLSRDGEYWNINSAGVFSKRYGKNKETVWSASEVQSGGSASTGDASQSEPNAGNGSPSNGTASNVSAGKGTNNSATDQEKDADNAQVADNKAEKEGVDVNPTEAQKEAGNYKKGHIKVDGYNVTIENPKGSVRRGKDAEGREWSITMNNTYGYIRGTEGVDGDHIDIFLSDNPDQGNVYVIDQVDAEGNFDEHKVMYGFGSAEEAREAYLANYSEGWTGLGTITEVSKEEFKKWIESSHRKTKPFSEYKSVKKESGVDNPTDAQNNKSPWYGTIDEAPATDGLLKSYRKELFEEGQSAYSSAYQKYVPMAQFGVEEVKTEPTYEEFVKEYTDRVGDYSAKKVEKYLPAFYEYFKNKLSEATKKNSKKKEQPSKAAEESKANDDITDADVDRWIAEDPAERKIREKGAGFESYGEYMRRNETSATDRIASRAYIQEVYGDVVVEGIEYAYPDVITAENAAEVARDLVDQKFDIDDCEAILRGILKAKSEAILPFFDEIARMKKEMNAQKTAQRKPSKSKPSDTSVYKPGRVSDAMNGNRPVVDPHKSRNNKRNHYDGAIYFGNSSYGITKADSDALSMLAIQYDSFASLYDAYQNGRVMISPELAGIVKLGADKNANIKDYIKPKDKAYNKAAEDQAAQLPDTGNEQEGQKEKIEDVGEKIGGARKDATLNYAKKIDLEANTPSKIFPKPNFASMEKAGVPHETLVKLKTYYTAFSITNKNKSKRNEKQRMMSARFYASIAKDMLLRDVDVMNESAEGIVLTDYGKEHLNILMACVEALDKRGREDFFDLDISDVDVFVREVKEDDRGYYETRDGRKWVGTYGNDGSTTMMGIGRKLFDMSDMEGIANEYCVQVEASHSKAVQDEIKFHIYRTPSGSSYITAKVKGVADEIRLAHDFASTKEAREYLNENTDALRTEASAKADEIKLSRKGGQGGRKPSNDDLERMLRDVVQDNRVGKNYRMGRDVSAEDFMSEFGFRGVEFGNWATQAERQEHLNNCYDALMDLADLIGVSPKALSLGGKLAFAFGARGHSAALAHYEPAKHVINLTKEHGAGCVAHEWFHALDNYFGGGVFGLHMKSAAAGNTRDDVRGEMRKIFSELGRALKDSDMYERSSKLGNKDYWGSTHEMAARAFESYVNERLMERGQRNMYLSAHVPGEDVKYEELAKNDPYPSAEEMRKFGEVFDRLFDTLQEKVDEDGNTVLFQMADVEPYTENNTEAEKLATEAVMTLLNETAGLDVVMNTQDEGQREAMRGTSEMMANERFNNELNDFKSKSHVGLLHLGNPGAKLRACGINVEELTLSPTVLNRHLRQHGLTEDDLVDLVNLINDPILVYKHGQNNPNIVVVTEKTVNGGKLSISVELDDNGNVVEIDNVRSVHSKEATKELTRLSNLTEDELRDNVRWVENEKVLDWLFGVGLDRRMPEEGSELFAVAKVLKNHENPIIEDEKSANTAEFMQVWHGSSAIFDQFDGAFMGTGEGSQVYGDGHYVTDVEGTGRMYAPIATENRQRSNTPIVWKGERIDFSGVNPLRMAYDVVDSARTIAEARHNAERYAGMAEEPDMQQKWNAVLDILKRSTKADFKKEPVKGNRQLYEIEIPDDNGKNYIDWNREYSRTELEEIGVKLNAIGNPKFDYGRYQEILDMYFDEDGNPQQYRVFTGEQLYRSLATNLAGGMDMDKRGASEMLSEAGIVGVKVPTGNRKGGDGRGMNYVVFNDADLKIKNRVEFMERPNGTVYGWSEGNRIHLTPEGVNANTPIHEYTHLWAKAVQKKAPKLWDNVKNLLKGTPIWDEVVNDPAYQGLTNDDEIASEALSRMSGRDNAKRMLREADKMIAEGKKNGIFAEAKARDLVMRMQNALKKFWQWVGKNLFDIEKFGSVEEVTDRVLYDLVNKTDLGLDENQGDALEFSRVTSENATDYDKKVMQEIADGKTKTVYRGMQRVEIDGKMYALPPMASKVNGEWAIGLEIHDDGTLEPTLLKADEHPELAKNGKFYLDKGNGKGLWAAYNPYWHVSDGMLNDQFSEAQSRDNLITVEGVIPMSELTDGYKAEGAKDAVGMHEWKAGIIQGELSGTRKVMLSRYFKGVRVVPNEEVAWNIYDQIKDKVEVMPTNVVPPAVREELEKLGVQFVETNNKNELLDGEHAGDRYTWWYGKNAEKNRAKKFKELAKEAGMKLSDWMKENGREGQLPDSVVKKADAVENGIRYRQMDEFEDGQELEIVNKKFNDELDKYTEEKADSFVFDLGKPSSVLIGAGVADKPMKLYGSKIAKKQKKHGFDVKDLKNLPQAMSTPIAVFDNYGKDGNRSVLTELKTNNGNILVAVDLGKGGDIDFNIISSAFGKNTESVEHWLRKGFATYIDNEKVQNYLNLAAPIAAAADNTELSTGAKVQPNNELNKFLGEKLYIRTENFKNWFGDWQMDPKNASKVVDENGEPLVVYHGTQLMEMYIKDGHFYTRNTDKFYTFHDGKGFFTSDKNDAESFTGGRKAGLYAVYLDIKNPFVYDLKGQDWDAIEGYDNEDGYKYVTTDYIVQDVKRRYPEYDGVILRNVGGENSGYIDHPIDDYIPFKAEQIKSATENNGDFDTDNKDIRFRQMYEFEDGQELEIKHDVWDGSYSVEGLSLPPENSIARLLTTFREKYAKYCASLNESGTGIVVTPWARLLANVRKKNRADNNGTRAQKKRAAFVERQTKIAIDMINEQAEKLGVTVEVRTDTDGLKERKARSKGWYDVTTGKIVIVLPNHTDGTDVMRTLMHEAVGHYGLRNLFGKDFDTVLDNVYASASEEIRRRIAELAAKNGWDFRVATEEYMAGVAEDIDYVRNNYGIQKWWNYLKHSITEFINGKLRELGFVLPFKMDDNDMRLLLWRSYENLANQNKHGILRAAEVEDMKQRTGVGYADVNELKRADIVADQTNNDNPDDDDPNGGGIRYRDAEDDAESTTEEDESGSTTAGHQNNAEEESESGEDGRSENGADDVAAVVGDEPMTLEQSIIDGLAKLSAKNRESLQLKLDVVRAIGGKLSELRKAMSAQRKYDRWTVDEVAGLARVMIKDALLDNLTVREVMRLLTIVKNATGKEDLTKAVTALYDMMVDNQLSNATDMLSGLMKVKAGKVNAQGVNVQGQLDVRGQKLIDAYKQDLLLKDKESIVERMNDAAERMSSRDNTIAEEAAIEYEALNLALQYMNDINGSISEETIIKADINLAKMIRNGKEADAVLSEDEDRKREQVEIIADVRNMSDVEYREYLQSLYDAIRQNRLERVEAYYRMAARLGGAMRGSVESAKQFNEREKERVENIHHFANSDLEGVPASAHGTENWKQKLANNNLLRVLFNPLGTFDQMMRMIGRKSVNGEGYLYNHFMRGYIDASDKEFRNYSAACKILDDKVSKVFGKKMRWSDLYSVERGMPKMAVTFKDAGSERTEELSQGNLLYIYMVNKMSDGRMKLRKMGITEDVVQNIKAALDPRFIELADWLQEEFLVQKRNDYNRVHERMFGAPMDAIENYFPLKILGDARVENVDVSEAEVEKNLPSVLTGSIIKRRRNSLALDVMNADAFSVVIEHLQNMERWAAFAEWKKDLNTLLSYKTFRNKLKNMSSLYGGGNNLWHNFMVACSVAAGTHRPKVDVDSVDTAFVNVAKGVTAAKISFRLFTALKQLLSSPAFVAEASMTKLANSFATPWASWNWAMQELPTFRKRWESKQAGDTRLMPTDADWEFWRNNIVETLGRWGMSPNAFVDAMTIAIGAKAMYETKLSRYLRDGYPKEIAEKKAKQDAAILFNQTQQSSEGAFISKMQVDRTVAAVALSVFRNSSFAYTRQLVDAVRELKRMMTPGYKERSIEYMEKQMIRDGLTELQAKRAATRAYNREWTRNMTRVALFGFAMQFAWNLGSYLPYLLFGGDDDDKQKMMEDAAMHALIGGVEGLTGGNVISELANMKMQGENWQNYNFNLLPLVSDVQGILNKYSSDKVAAVNDIVNLIIQAGIGVNPQTVEDAVVAIMDAVDNDAVTGREAAMLMLRLIQAPQSSIDKLYLDELGMRGDEATKLSVSDMAMRYAKYKKHRGAAMTEWAYDEYGERAVEDKYIKRFENMAKERLMSTGDIQLDEAYDKYKEELEPLKKRVESIGRLENRDPERYDREMDKISETNDYFMLQQFEDAESEIKDLINDAIVEKDMKERESILKEMAEKKRDIVRLLDSLSHKVK